MYILKSNSDATKFGPFDTRPNWYDGEWRSAGSVVAGDPDGSAYEVISLVTPVTPIQFKMLFKSAERIKLYALRATDPIIADMFNLIDDPRLTEVDLNLQSNKDAVAYCFAQLVTAGTVTSADEPGRIAAVLSGVLI